MAKNSDRKNDNTKYYTFQEQEDAYIFENYGVKVKNRASKKPQKKFTEKRQK